MSLREELDYVIGRRREYNDAETGRHWEAFASAAYRLIRDHGQALLDALEDAERYRWLRDESNPNVCAFYLSVGMALQGVKFQRETVDQFIDHSRRKTADQAIDAAIKGDG